jgi:hypothetical protein
MRKHHWVAGFVLLCGPGFASPAWAAATQGVTTIPNPGGGTIAYAQLPQQHTAQGAMGKVLQYAQSSLGARPAIGKVMKSPDGNSLAVTFTVTPKSGAEIAGLALVAVSADGPGAGAVLSDTNDHFRTSLKPMLARLQQEAVAKGGSAGAQAAIANAGGTSATSQTQAKTSSSSGAASQTAPSGTAIKPSAPAAKLTQTPLPDGTASLGLPAGWRITAAHQGDVTAGGPNGEMLRFGMAQSVLDPNNPQSRTLGYRPGGMAPANFVAIPPGTPGDVAYKSMLAQLTAKQRKPAPVMTYTLVKQLPSGSGGGTSWVLIANVTSTNVVAWTQIAMSAPMALGAWQMNVYTITVPQALANQEAATIGPMFQSYKQNNQAMMGSIHADMQTTNQIFNNFMYESKKMMDASDRSTTATTNYLLGNTVVNDSALNAHGTVPDDVANALMAADPNRFQSVSSGSYWKGIDY